MLKTYRVIDFWGFIYHRSYLLTIVPIFRSHIVTEKCTIHSPWRNDIRTSQWPYKRIYVKLKISVTLNVLLSRSIVMVSQNNGIWQRSLFVTSNCAYKSSDALRHVGMVFTARGSLSACIEWYYWWTSSADLYSVELDMSITRRSKFIIQFSVQQVLCWNDSMMVIVTDKY